MQTKDGLDLAKKKALEIAKNKGFVTFDDIIEAADSFGLSFDAIDLISGCLLDRGIIIKDDDEISKNNNDRSRLDYELIYTEIIRIDSDLEPLINDIRQIYPPQLREAEDLVLQAQDGNRYARNRLCEMFLKIVLREALYFYKHNIVELDEAIHYGTLGLIKAIDEYNSYQHYKFSTYAPWWIRQSMQRSCHTFNHFVRFPVHMKERISKLYILKKRHSCELCSEKENDYVCPNLIAEAEMQLGIDRRQIQELFNICMPFLSFEDFYNEDEDEYLISSGCITEDTYLEEFDKEYIAKQVHIALERLKPREQLVIVKRFGLNGEEPMTLEDIGNQLKLTRERIRQIESKGIRKLKGAKFKNFLKGLLD